MMMSNIMAVLQTVLRNQKIISKKVDSLIQEKILPEDTREYEDFLKDYPILTAEGLVSFERQLDDKQFRKKMISALKFSSTAKKATLQKNVNSIMKSLFSDNLLCKYSLCGAKEKKTFLSHPRICRLVWQVVADASGEGESFAETQKNVNLKIGDWLKHAAERLKRNKDRKILECEMHKLHSLSQEMDSAKKAASKK